MKATTIIYRFLKGGIAILPFKKAAIQFYQTLIYTIKKIRRELKFSGAFKVKADKKSFLIMNYDYKIHTLENDVFWLGLEGWEPQSIHLWMKLTKESKVVFDIGANTGIYTLVSACLNSETTIHAFEPVERIFNKFEKNISLNNFNSIRTHKIALSNENGTAKLYDFVGDIPLNATLNSSWHSDSNARVEKEVKTQRLDSFIEENKIDRIDLMKVDVELFEPQVLEGMGKYLTQFKPNMLLEIFNEEIWNKIFSLIKNSGYDMFYIDEKKGARKISGYEKFEGYNFLFLNQDTSKKLFN